MQLHVLTQIFKNLFYLPHSTNFSLSYTNLAIFFIFDIPFLLVKTSIFNLGFPIIVSAKISKII